MKLHNTASGCIVLLGLALWMVGCTNARMVELRHRLGLDPDPASARLEPALASRIDRLYQEGAAALIAGDMGKATERWRLLVAAAPAGLPKAHDVRGYITLLERESAKRWARQAAAREAATGRLPTDRRHVAVIPFANRHEPAWAGAPVPFNRAMVAMIMTDLSRVPALKILEREKLAALMAEMRLQASGLTDEVTASRLAFQLGAGTVVTGTVLNTAGSEGYESGRYKITTALADVESGRIIGTQEAEGPIGIWYRLQKEIVYELLDGMGIKDIPPSVGKIHTRNWDAYAAFARGLKHLEEGDFEDARQAFYLALRYDPNFTLAEAAFLGTPARALSLEELKAALQ